MTLIARGATRVRSVSEVMSELSKCLHECNSLPNQPACNVLPQAQGSEQPHEIVKQKLKAALAVSAEADHRGLVVSRAGAQGHKVSVSCLFGDTNSQQHEVLELLQRLLGAGLVDPNERDPARFGMTLLQLVRESRWCSGLVWPFVVLRPACRVIDGSCGQSGLNVVIASSGTGTCVPTAFQLHWPTNLSSVLISTPSDPHTFCSSVLFATSSCLASLDASSAGGIRPVPRSREATAGSRCRPHCSRVS